MNLDDPIEVALIAAEALDSARLPCALYGGLLTAVYGEPRETRVADFVVINVRAEEAKTALTARGVDAVVAFDEVVFGGLRVGRVTLLPGEDATGLNTVDVIQPRDDAYAARVLQRAVSSTLREKSIRVVSAEDYVLLKLLSTRDRDLEDAAAVYRVSGEILDLQLIDDEFVRLDRALPDADLAARRRALEERVRTAR